jgi:peroxidase
MNMTARGYEVPLGRLDSLHPAPLSKVLELPGPDFNATELIESFQSRNLTMEDLVALSGAHTVGRSRCNSFKNRVGESAEFVQTLRENCARNPYAWRQDLDVTTPHEFDNIKQGKGVFNSDMALMEHMLHASAIK